MKTFVVGDVHGRHAQLDALLEMLPRDEAADTLVFLGDLIDRGPDAPGCVSLVMKLQQENSERVLCLRGNHEYTQDRANCEYDKEPLTVQHCTLLRNAEKEVNSSRI